METTDISKQERQTGDSSAVVWTFVDCRSQNMYASCCNWQNFKERSKITGDWCGVAFSLQVFVRQAQTGNRAPKLNIHMYRTYVEVRKKDMPCQYIKSAPDHPEHCSTNNQANKEKMDFRNESTSKLCVLSSCNHRAPG